MSSQGSEGGKGSKGSRTDAEIENPPVIQISDESDDDDVEISTSRDHSTASASASSPRWITGEIKLHYIPEQWRNVTMVVAEKDEKIKTKEKTKAAPAPEADKVATRGRGSSAAATFDQRGGNGNKPPGDDDVGNGEQSESSRDDSAMSSPPPPEVVVIDDSDDSDGDDDHNANDTFELVPELTPDEKKLHQAVDQKDHKVIEELIKNGVNINIMNDDDETPLIRAAIGKDKTVCLRIIKYLIENGADEKIEDGGGRTFIHRFLEMEGRNLVPSQFHELVVYLIGKNCGSLFNTPDEENMATPLHLAVETLDVQERTLTLLHKSGVDFKATYVGGNCVLAAAVKGQRSNALLSALIMIGADWKHLNEHRQNLLHISVQHGNYQAAKYFFGLGLHVDSIDLSWDTPLHHAVKYGTGNVLMMVNFLVEKGANRNTVNKEGLTPLELAASRKEDIADKDQVIKLLTEGSSTSKGKYPKVEDKRLAEDHFMMH